MQQHVITYRFASEAAPRSLRTTAEKWSGVRYALERRHLETQRRHGWSFLVGMMAQDWLQCGKKFDASKALQSFQKLGSGVSLVVFRRPYPRALRRDDSVMRQGVFVPLEFRQDILPTPLNTANMCEDDKIAASMCMGLELFKKKGEYLHPADYSYVGVTPVPHAGYVCSGCQQGGDHFRVDCPSGGGDAGRDGSVPMDKIRKAYGIPKSLLKRVEDPCAHKNVMKTEEGHFVVRVQEATAASPAAARVLPPAPAPATATATDVFDFELVLMQKDAVAAAANPRKRKPKHSSTCTHWLRGLCVKGSACDFMHDASPEYMPICKFYKVGQCASDEVCMFRHVAPPRAYTSICSNYVKGFCELGPKCRHQHVKRRRPMVADWEQCGVPRGEFIFLEAVLS